MLVGNDQLALKHISSFKEVAAKLFKVFVFVTR